MVDAVWQKKEGVVYNILSLIRRGVYDVLVEKNKARADRSKILLEEIERVRLTSRRTINTIDYQLRIAEWPEGYVQCNQGIIERLEEVKSLAWGCLDVADRIFLMLKES